MKKPFLDLSSNFKKIVENILNTEKTRRNKFHSSFHELLSPGGRSPYQAMNCFSKSAASPHGALQGLVFGPFHFLSTEFVLEC